MPAFPLVSAIDRSQEAWLRCASSSPLLFRSLVVEDTPDIHPGNFEPVRGRRARRSRATGEIWQKDLLHGDHWEVYKSMRDFEAGQRSRAVWSDGRLKDRFQ